MDEEDTSEMVSAAEAVWAWSLESPPRRVDLARGEVSVSDIETSCVRALDRLDIEVAGLPIEEGTLVGNPMVIAAPRAMWREVPEPLLPRWPVDVGRADRAAVQIPVDDEGELRLRLVAEGRGSRWVDLRSGPGPYALTASPAPDVATALVDQEDRPIDAGLVQIFWSDSRSARDSTYDRDLAFFPAEAGAVWIPALPRGLELKLIARAPEHLERYLEVTSDRFPSMVSLDRGCRVSGTVSTWGGEPLGGVTVEAEGFLAGEGLVAVQRQAISEPDGGWTLEVLPRSRVLVRLEKAGNVAETLEIDLSRCEGSRELETVALESGDLLRVRVTDLEGRPLEGAQVTISSSGATFATSARGIAELEPVSRSRHSELTVEAPGFLPKDVLAQPAHAELDVALTPAVQIRGRVLDEDGGALENAIVQITQKKQFRQSGIPPDGLFELEVEPGIQTELHFRSRRTLEVTENLRPFEAGEEVDLGDIVLPRGVTIRGSLRGAVDGRPVAGARVWSHRQGPGSEIVAWYQGDRLEASSDTNGRFELSGLLSQPVSLSVEARGFARLERSAISVSEAEDGVVDLGILHLDPGARLTVLGESDWVGTVRVGLGGSWNEARMISAPFYEGEGVLENVSPGVHTVSIEVGERIVCDRSIEISSGEEAVRTECRGGRVRVIGTVTVGGRASDSGTLMWRSATGAGDHLIVNHVRESGLMRQRVLGRGRGSVSVAVDSSGYYETEEIAPGKWQVSWVSEAGGFSPPRSVEVPEVEELVLPLEFSPSSLRGFVVDREDRPVALARVAGLESRATAITGDDGAFELLDLSPGLHTVVATKGDLGSEPQLVELGDNGQRNQLRLVLEPREDHHLEIAVLEDGSPAAGALVFLETDDGATRVYSADSSGVTEAILPTPRPSAVRAACAAGGSWAFGPWTMIDEAIERGIRLDARGAGTLELHSSGVTGAPLLSAPGGWNLSDLLRRLGVPSHLGPDSPVVITGLPAGPYSVMLGDRSRPVSLGEADFVRLVLD